jgi:hypothetical protein
VHTLASLAASPLTPGEHERLGLIDLATGAPLAALDEFARERKLRINGRGLEVRFGQAYQALGQKDRAIAHYRAELRLDAGNEEASAALTALGAGP